MVKPMKYQHVQKVLQNQLLYYSVFSSHHSELTKNGIQSARQTNHQSTNQEALTRMSSNTHIHVDSNTLGGGLPKVTLCWCHVLSTVKPLQYQNGYKIIQTRKDVFCFLIKSLQTDHQSNPMSKANHPSMNQPEAYAAHDLKITYLHDFESCRGGAR